MILSKLFGQLSESSFMTSISNQTAKMVGNVLMSCGEWLIRK